MSEEEGVWKKICLCVWFGQTVEQIKNTLEREYGIEVTSDIEELIRAVEGRYSEIVDEVVKRKR